MRALVIDDSRAIRTILGKTLQGLGFQVEQAGDGVDGLSMLKQHGAFEVVCVDWNMPEMDGFKFLKLVRANPAYNEMPIMMVTTETEMEQMVRALEAGANEYVMKPFTKDMIREKLELMGVLQ